MASFSTVAMASFSSVVDRPKATSDMADIIDLMLGTGSRIGEILALRWRDVDLDAARVRITGTIKTETGMGTYRKPITNARTVGRDCCTVR